MKAIYNTDQHKTIVVHDGNREIRIRPFTVKEVSDEVAAIVREEYPAAQVTETLDESVSQVPWELSILPSLPPEMRNKVKFNDIRKEDLVPAATPEVVEPPADPDRSNGGANVHVCPNGCGFSSERVREVRNHQKGCSPRSAFN